MAYPIFRGDLEENALEFCDQFKIASLREGKNEEEMVRIFPYTLRSGARVWINNLELHLKQEWHILKANFTGCFEVKESTRRRYNNSSSKPFRTMSSMKKHSS